MRFRWTLLIFFLANLSLGFFAGCSYFFDQKEEPKIVRLDRKTMGLTGCLGSIGQVAQDYFTIMDPGVGEILDHNITELSGCYNEALGMFRKHTKSGKKAKGVYPAEEVSSFLQKMFPDQSFDQAFVEQVLQFKSYFIGGSPRGVTAKEIVKIGKAIEVIAQGFVDVRPYRAILLQKAKLTRNKKGIREFDAAFTALSSASNRLLNFLDRPTRRKMDLELIGQFVLNSAYGEKEARDKEPYINLLLSFKHVALNDNSDDLKFSDLDAFFQQALLSYKSIVEFHLFLKDDNLFANIGTIATFITQVPSLLSDGQVLRGQPYRSLVRILDRIIENLTYSIRRSDDGILEVDKISNLLFKLEDSGFVSKKLSAKTIAQFTESVIVHWLLEEQVARPYLSKQKLSFLKKRISWWDTRHSFINQVMKDRESIPLPELIQTYLSQQSQSHRLSKDAMTALDQWMESNPRDPIAEWLKVLTEVHLKKWSKQKRLVFSRGSLPLTYEDLIAANSIFTELEAFMRRYQEGSRPSVLTYQVSKSETQEIYDGIRDIGLALKIMDARSFATGERSFFEANVFSTQRSNDQVMDMREAFELLAVLYGSGEVSKQIFQDIDEGCKLDFVDVLDKEVIRPNCFRQFFRENFITYFDQLEGLSSFWSTLTGEQQDQFLQQLEMISREGQVLEREISMGDIRYMVSVVYYLQSIFFNFDSSGDNIVKGEELKAFEEHFWTFTNDFILKAHPEILNVVNEEFVDSRITPLVFSYILVYQEIPTPKWLLLHQATNWGWMKKEPIVDFSSMASIMRLISNSGRVSQIKKISEFLDREREQLLYDFDMFEESPDCSTGTSKFCQFANLSNCSFEVHEDFFFFLKSRQEEFFASGQETIQLLDGAMNRDPLWSTQCKFPVVVEGD